MPGFRCVWLGVGSGAPARHISVSDFAWIRGADWLDEACFFVRLAVTFLPFPGKVRDSTMKKAMPVSRSARFTSGPGSDVAAFSQSSLLMRVLLGMIFKVRFAHAKMLAKIGILTPAEGKDIIRGLEQIGAEIGAGKFKWKVELEDVSHEH